MSRLERLQRLLGGAQLSELRARLRSRYERGAGSGIVTLARLSETERAALAGLLGRPLRLAASMRIDIGALDAALRRGGLADSLHSALEMLDGPITDRVAERASLQDRWDGVHRTCEAQLATLLDDARGHGLLKRLAHSDPDIAAQLCEAAQCVLLRLPAAGMARSRLAAEVLGDAHALDAGRPVATLVLAALRRQRNRDEADDIQYEESARATWADAGVLVNELARPALFLNLPAAGAVLAQGEPGYLSLRALLRAPPHWEVAARTVFVCENPNLLAIAADALGRRCAPLVCTDGMPAAAQRTLLAQLAAAGAGLCYHGDFDWPGVRIGNWVMRRCNAQPWRYRAHDYLAAVTAADEYRRPLGADRCDAGWDAELAAAMQAGGRAIDEEVVADALLADLALGRLPEKRQ
ncbi:MAG: TIGR02679 family protein [Oxalobacteraceae bacterium]|nr:TIGR02679 family protein [Oxalobacteraceae bacterium]